MVNSRVIVLIDMDCFYVQAEQRLKPELYGKPVAVIQHSTGNIKGGGLLAVSYEARAFGVKRGMFGEQAKKLCPDLKLCYVPVGEHIDKADITRYREASAEVFKVLHEFDSRIVVERASVDEAYLDLTAIVNHIMGSTSCSTRFSRESVVDSFPTTHVADGVDLNHEELPDWDYDRVKSLQAFIEKACKNNDQKMQLIVAADLVERIRADIKKETAFSCSAGIGSSKMIAKLVCSRHKPGQQTIVADEAIPYVFKYTPITAVRNLGGKLGNSLMTKYNITFMGELSKFSMAELAGSYPNQATWIFNIARGIDDEPVTARDKQSSVAVSKNFPGASALVNDSDVRFWLEGLVKELVKRLTDDQVKNTRTATSLHLSCLMDTHVSRTVQLTSYDVTTLFKKTWAKLTELKKTHSNTWNPPIRNIFLSADRFRDGIDTRSRKITEWVQQTKNKDPKSPAVRRVQTKGYQPASSTSSHMVRSMFEITPWQTLPSTSAIESSKLLNQKQSKEVSDQIAVGGMFSRREGDLSRAQIAVKRAMEGIREGSPPSEAYCKLLHDRITETSLRKEAKFPFLEHQSGDGDDDIKMVAEIVKLPSSQEETILKKPTQIKKKRFEKRETMDTSSKKILDFFSKR